VTRERIPDDHWELIKAEKKPPDTIERRMNTVCSSKMFSGVSVHPLLHQTVTLCSCFDSEDYWIRRRKPRKVAGLDEVPVVRED
jgi:hypothetical protein